MLPVFTADEMRRLDRRAIESLGISGATLMENAGRGAAEAIIEFMARPGRRGIRGARVAIVCGKGGNGGDGFVVARWLRRRGARVSVLLLAPAGEITGDAARKLLELRRAGVRPEPLEDDATLGPRLAAAGLGARNVEASRPSLTTVRVAMRCGERT